MENFVLFFSLQKLENEAKNNSIRFIGILEDHYNKKYKKSYYINKINSKPIDGSSFLLNPKPLFSCLVDKSYIVQYIKLAGRRDYTLYNLYGIKSLDLSYFPDINIENIKHNPLIKLLNNHIYFKFEELNGTRF